MLMLLLCNVFTLSAAEELYAQHYNVTLSLRNATVKEAVDAVTRQTGIAFSYESSVGVMPLGNVEIRVDGGAVDAVLGPPFADKGIAWQVVDGVVILTRQNSPPQSDSGRRLTVRGRITAGAGESIVGATVMVKGTQTGVSSDVEGNYEIVVPGPGSVLVFNYLGYQPQEIAVGNRTQIDVRLAEDNNVLDDVVVIGYGTQSRRTLTSAVSKVSGADLEGVPVNSIGDALKGKVPGVRISTANNQPGSDPVFLIRGGSSINQSNAPIIIVDGVRREMTGLNTNDIESIEILKDAASAGIYGASASNGVILVTTKKGNRAKGPQITFEASQTYGYAVASGRGYEVVQTFEENGRQLVDHDAAFEFSLAVYGFHDARVVKAQCRRIDILAVGVAAHAKDFRGLGIVQVEGKVVARHDPVERGRDNP